MIVLEVEPVWMEDHEGANLYAQTYEPVYTSERKYRYPPHHLRCNFMRAGIRCAKGEGHHHGVGPNAEHEEPKNAVL